MTPNSKLPHSKIHDHSSTSSTTDEPPQPSQPPISPGRWAPPNAYEHLYTTCPDSETFWTQMETSPTYRKNNPWNGPAGDYGGTVRHIYHPKGWNMNVVDGAALVEALVSNVPDAENAALNAEREAYLTERVCGDSEPRASLSILADFRAAAQEARLDAGIAMPGKRDIDISWGTSKTESHLQVEKQMSPIRNDNGETEDHDCGCNDAGDEDDDEMSTGNPFLMLRCPYAVRKSTDSTTIVKNTRPNHLNRRLVAQEDGKAGFQTDNDRDFKSPVAKKVQIEYPPSRYSHRKICEDVTCASIHDIPNHEHPDHGHPDYEPSGLAHVKIKKRTALPQAQPSPPMRSEMALSLPKLSTASIIPRREKTTSNAPKIIRKRKMHYLESLISLPRIHDYPNTRARARFLLAREFSELVENESARHTTSLWTRKLNHEDDNMRLED